MDRPVLPTRLLGPINEMRAGAKHMQDQRDEQFRQVVAECPPIDPHLIAHLDIVFADVVNVKPDHPQLSNLLLVQHGVNKIKKYLKDRYDYQSGRARRERDI